MHAVACFVKSNTSNGGFAPSSDKESIVTSQRLWTAVLLTVETTDVPCLVYTVQVIDPENTVDQGSLIVRRLEINIKSELPTVAHNPLLLVILFFRIRCLLFISLRWPTTVQS